MPRPAEARQVPLPHQSFTSGSPGARALFACKVRGGEPAVTWILLSGTIAELSSLVVHQLTLTIKCCNKSVKRLKVWAAEATGNPRASEKGLVAAVTKDGWDRISGFKQGRRQNKFEKWQRKKSKLWPQGRSLQVFLRAQREPGEGSSPQFCTRSAFSLF